MTRATDQQVWLIRKLGRELGYTVDGDAQELGHVLHLVGREHWASLRVYEASALIARLKRESTEVVA